jgi:TPR repeat protein
MLRAMLIWMIYAILLTTQAMAETVVEKLMKAAEEGNVEAQLTLGSDSLYGVTRYADGSGVPKDYAAAEKWLSQAAKNDHLFALYTLGQLYKDGADEMIEGQKSFVERDEWKAGSILARFVALGERREPDAGDKEKKWLAEHLPRAMSDLGDIYYQECDSIPSNLINIFPNCGRDRGGHLAMQSFAAAFGWYERSAKRNEPWAHYRLGRMFELGRAVPQDFQQALAQYEIAAERGINPARYTLGKLNQKLGNNLAAYMWLNLAVWGSNQHDNALVEHRDALLSKLTPQEILSAQQKARLRFEASKRSKLRQ